MEQKFSNHGIDLQMLREFCEGEGELVEYRKGDQMEREGDPSRWFGYVTEGCFKYVNHGISDDKEHITWFSFAGEFVTDYPTFLYGRPSQTTIVAMMPSRVLRVTGQQLEQFFDQSKDTMKLRAIIAEHILFQFRSRYLDLHCATARERYELLLDIVAIDQACQDLTSMAYGCEHVFKDVNHVSGMEQLQYAEKLGMGHTKYILIDVATGKQITLDEAVKQTEPKK